MKSIIYLLFISFLLFQHSVFGQDTIPQKKCIDCHAKIISKKIKHGNIGETCDKCHKANNNLHPLEDVEGFALVAKVPDLCFGCHIIKRTDTYTHPPYADGTCLDCHDVHSSNEVKMISVKAPGLCLSCHSDMGDLIKKSAMVHQAVNEKKSCVNCHSPHASPEKKMLLAKRKDLCLSCHNKAVTTKTKTLSNFEKLMKTSKVMHPPFEDCEKICHNPHSSNDKRLLDLPFPTNNYLSVKSDSFALCWECHGSDMIEKPKTKGATNFRNDDTNLHYVHVHGEKGRSCMMCHSPHATNNQHLIREKVQFGSWQFKMNYKSNENGGSCLPSCHGEKAYTR